jgi:hypothetical protein
MLLLNAFTAFLARPLKRGAGVDSAEARSLSRMLRPGDVLLTSGNTRAAALVRRVTGSPWAHVSLYVGPLEEGPDAPCIVEADIAAGVRAIRLSQLEGQRVRVLRPIALPEIDRRRLAAWMVERIGDQYDLAQAWALAGRLLRLPWAARMPSAAEMAEGAKRFICSSLVAQAFLLVGHHIEPAQVRARASWAPDHRHVTPPDFEKASGFEVVNS